MDSFHFDEQRKNFDHLGYTLDPTTGKYVGNIDNLKKLKGFYFFMLFFQKKKEKKKKIIQKKI